MNPPSRLMAALGPKFCDVITLSVFILTLLDVNGETVPRVRTVMFKSNKLTTAADMIPVAPAGGAPRARRSLFNAQLKRDLVDRHNDVRRLENSSNMEFMVWNDFLADMAEDWAELCRWEHGQPSRDPAELPYPNLGQNLYVYNGTFDAVHGVQLWYDEVVYYNYDTGGCSVPPCGHYTQVVWASTKEVGCAYNLCPTLQKLDIINGHYLVCNYGPGGNYVGEKPHRKGKACSQCDSGKLWCDEGLCRSDCTSQSTKCECRASCQNCAETVRSDCTCSCQPGWTGPDCSEVCRNTDEYCGANPGWPVSWCDRDYVLESCPLMCGICRPATAQTAFSCPTNTESPGTDNPTTDDPVFMVPTSGEPSMSRKLTKEETVTLVPMTTIATEPVRRDSAMATAGPIPSSSLSTPTQASTISVSEAPGTTFATTTPADDGSNLSENSTFSTLPDLGVNFTELQSLGAVCKQSAGSGSNVTCPSTATSNDFPGGTTGRLGATLAAILLPVVVAFFF